MNIPDWYTLLLLTLAGFRTWRLLSEDELLDWPRRRLLRLGDWQEEGDSVPANYRKTLGAFVGCAYCLGAWIALGWWIAWQVWPNGTTIAAVPFALSALVGITRGKLDPPE